MNKFSEYYYEVINKYKLFHKNGIRKGDVIKPGSTTFLGYSLTKWIVKIRDIIRKDNCNSLLDFGCGKAFLYKNKFKIGDKEFSNLSDFWNVQDIYLYDPGLEEYSTYPKEKYDGTICTDVVEHIPEADVISFIDELFKLSNKFIFVVIAIRPATKYFEDGNNIHLSLKKQDEWKKIFLSFKEKYPFVNQYIYFNE